MEQTADGTEPSAEATGDRSRAAQRSDPLSGASRRAKRRPAPSAPWWQLAYAPLSMSPASLDSPPLQKRVCALKADDAEHTRRARQLFPNQSRGASPVGIGRNLRSSLRPGPSGSTAHGQAYPLMNARRQRVGCSFARDPCTTYIPKAIASPGCSSGVVRVVSGRPTAPGKPHSNCPCRPALLVCRWPRVCDPANTWRRSRTLRQWLLFANPID